MQPHGLRTVVAAFVLLAACSESPDQRVRVSGDAAQRLLASGGKLVQDYGTFQVIEAGEAARAAISAGEAEPLDARILLNAGAFDPDAVRRESVRTTVIPATGRALNLVQFVGPVRPEWHDALAATGVRIVTYIPNDAYLVYGDAAAVNSMLGMARSSQFVRWTGAYLDSDKLDPTVQSVDTGAWSVQLVEDAEANEVTMGAVALLEREITRVSSELGYVNLVVHCDASEAVSLAARSDVVSIQPFVEPTKNDERQAMLVSGNVSGNVPSGPGYLAWLAARGFNQAQFTASGFGVDVSDSGVDNATLTPNHFALYAGGNVAAQSRFAYARLEGTPHAGSTIQGCDGHGNINAHIVAGYTTATGTPHVDAEGYRYGVGIAPFVRVGSSVIFDPNTFTNPDYEDLQSRAWADGMRISTNSWGAASSVYNSDSQRYDALVRDAAPTASAVPVAGNQEMVIVFAAGNSGSSSGTVGRPGNAKNVICVGGTEGVQAFGAADGCGIADSDASSVQDIVWFSSRGPAADGRRKPDLVAPASHISGGVAQADGQRADPPGNPNGAALSCFNGGGVCGGVASNFFPSGQEWNTASSGTSHSTPAIAGGAALVRQWFINQGWSTPSPAMTKAYLMSSARYLTGSSANDTLPSNAQGMGLMDLGMAFDDAPRRLVDQTDLLTATGQTATFIGTVADPSRPFRVTLAWTDAPGSTTGAAWNNDLDLTVTVGGTTYRGNVFSGAGSASGGVADSANNVESVFLPAGVSGPFTITVTAANINSDGVPGNSSTLDQDFALVVYGACTSAPDAPTGVTATATAPNEVTISWTPNGAPEYRIYRGTSSGGPYSLIGSATDSPFVDATVSGLTTYYYVVRGVLCAESPDSNEAPVTATGACTLPPIFGGLTSATSNGTATCGNTLSWSPATASCGGSITYSVFRSTAPGFTPGTANRIAAGLTSTSFADDLNLEEGRTYYYTVRAIEAAEATSSDENDVEMAVAAHGPAATNYFDDFDANRPANASAYWIPTTVSGTSGTLNLPAGCRYQSATQAYRFGAANSTACGVYYPNGTQALLSLGGNGSVAGINGFTVGVQGTLTFNQWYYLEPYYDSAWLVYSTTSATGPWTYVPDSQTAGQPYITAGGYDRDDTQSGYRAWSGSRTSANGALGQVSVNLDALAGQQVWLGWRFYTDSSVVYEGFYVDDVRISSFGSCTTNVPAPGPAASFVVSLPASTGAGASAPMTVTAIDAVGVTATGYTGTASVASTDAQGVVPPTITFAAGVATTTVELRTLGTQTVTVTDLADSTITGTGTTSVTAGAPARLDFSVQPAGAVAGVAIAPSVRVQISDAFGNLTGATDAVTVALGANPGGDTLAGTLTANAVAGVATFSDLVLDVAAAGYTLVASSGTYDGATSEPFTIDPAADASLDFVQQASTTVAGDAISPSPAVAIRDVHGNVTHSSAIVMVGLTGGTAGATLSGTTMVAAIDGVATFADLSVDRVGTGYQLAASSGGLTDATGAAFDITPAAADHLLFVEEPTNIVAGDPFTPTVSVAVLDRFENLATNFVGNVLLGLAVNPTGAALTGMTTQTPIGGVATFADVSLLVSGSSYALSASSNLLHGATSVSFDVAVGPVTQLVFASEPAASVAGAPIAGPPTVHLADVHGNRQPTAVDPVTIALGANPGGDTLGGTLTVNAVAGVATFPDLVLDRAAAGYTLVATSGAYDPATSVAFGVAPAADARVEFVQQASNTAAGDAISPAPTVAVRDAYGNLTHSSAGVNVALTGGTSGATLSGTRTVAAVDGVATFGDLSVDLVGAGYQLAASSGGLTGATGAAFAVGPAAPHHLAFVQGPSDVLAGAAFSPAVSAQVLDRFGNVVTGFGGDVTLGLAVNPTGAALIGATTVAATAGVATFPGISLQRAGSAYALSASSSTLVTATSSSFDVLPGPVAQLLFVSQPTGSVAGSPVAGPPSVQLADAHGNATSATDAVTMALGENPGGDTLGGTLTVNAVAGVATFADLVLDRAAAGYTLVANSGAHVATSGAFTVAPAAGAYLEFVTAPGVTPAGAPIEPTPAVQVYDAYGNAATSSTATITMALGSNPSSGTLSGVTAVAAAGGNAAFPGLSIDAAGAGYTLTATGTGLTSATSGSFDVVAGPPAVLVFLSQPGTVEAGATVPGLTVEIRDAWGNRTAATDEVLIGIATAPGGATLAGTRWGSAVDGRAVFSDLSIDRAGTGYALSAVVAGLPAAVTDLFDVTPGPAARYAVSGLPSSVEAETTTTISLAAYDQFGNLATGYAGSASFSSTDASATLPATATFAGGHAAGLDVTLRTGGAHVVTATDDGDGSIQGSATTVVIAPDAPAPPEDSGGCGCGSGNPGEIGLLLMLAGLWRTAAVRRRHSAAGSR
jgi:hypothetical protein